MLSVEQLKPRIRESWSTRTYIDVVELAVEHDMPLKDVYDIYVQATTEAKKDWEAEQTASQQVQSASITANTEQSTEPVMPKAEDATREIQKSEPVGDEGWTDEEAIEFALDKLKQGNSDAEVRDALIDEFADSENDADSFIKAAHVRFSELLKNQEEKIEAAERSEDEARKLGMEAVDQRIQAELKYKAQWLETYLLKKNLGRLPKDASDAEVEKFFAYYQEAEKLEKQWADPAQLDTPVRVKEFQLDLLPPSIRERVRDVSERTSTPLDFAGIASVISLAGVTGRRVFVYPKALDKEWREAIALSGAVVAASGETKTPVWKAFTDPIIEVDAGWTAEHNQRMKQYKAAVERWERNLKDAQKKKDIVAQNTLAVQRPEEPPVQRQCITNDATPEAFHSLMQNNPEGLFYHRDELSGFVEELDMSGRESQRGIFMTAMDGDANYSMQRIGRGEITARMCVSLCGNFQPNRLEAFLSHARNIEDGLVPRFALMVYPKTEFKRLTDRPVDANAKLLYRHIIRRLAEMKVDSVEMHFAPDAQQTFNDWLQRMIVRVRQEESEWKRSHLSKYKGALPKLAALFQLVDTIATGVSPLHPDINLDSDKQPEKPAEFGRKHLIDLAHLQQAMQFLEYLESHMHRIYDTVKSPLKKAEAVLAGKIKDGSLRSGFTFRDIVRKGWSGLRDPEIVTEAVSSLEQAHWIRPMPEPPIWSRGGRPKEPGWEINPALK